MESQSALNGPSVMPASTRPRIVARACSTAEDSVAMVVLPRWPRPCGSRTRHDDRPTSVVLNHPTFEPIVFPRPTPRQGDVMIGVSTGNRRVLQPHITIQRT